LRVGEETWSARHRAIGLAAARGDLGFFSDERTGELSNEKKLRAGASPLIPEDSGESAIRSVGRDQWLANSDTNTARTGTVVVYPCLAWQDHCEDGLQMVLRRCVLKEHLGSQIPGVALCRKVSEELGCSESAPFRGALPVLGGLSAALAARHGTTDQKQGERCCRNQGSHD